MRPELVGLKAGPKHKWLEDHHGEVYAYYQLHGEKATMEEFGLRRVSTLEATLNYKPNWKIREDEKRFDHLEILMMQTQAAVQQYHHEQIETNRQFNEFQSAVANQITENFIKPLFSLVIKLPPGLEVEEDDPLSLEKLRQRLGKNESER